MPDNNKVDTNKYSFSGSKIPDYAKPDTLINVNETSYDVMEDWTKLLKNHYNINLDNLSNVSGEQLRDSEVNLLKSGILGYTNELMAQEVKAAVAHRNTLYDEYFINSASFPESIYNFAKTHNVPISTATPSHMLVKLAIRKDDLITSPLRKEVIENQYVQNNTLKTFEVLLPRHYHFTVGKFKYMLPYDVIVTLRQRNNSSYSITAKYDIDNNLYKFTEYPKIEINTYQDFNNGHEYVYFDLDIYQLESQTSVFTVVNNDVSDNLFFTAEYKDQIAGFNVYYIQGNKRIPLDLYFNNMYTPNDPEAKFCYYSFLDDDKFQISFSNMPNTFKPDFNSLLEIEVLSTKGVEGNFTYNGKIQYSIENVDRSSFRTMLVSVVPVTSSAGGKDRLTIEQEKNRIITKMTTRNNLITNYDLTNYFNEINDLSSYNNSFIKFMKKRDDVLLRVYNAFLLMKDNNEMIIPSTTAPLVNFPVSWFIDNNSGSAEDGYVIPEHALFRYDTKNKIYKHINEGYSENIKEEILSDKDNLLYANPFLIRVDTKPILNAYYYKLDINRDFDLQYSYRNSLIDTTLIVNKISISKSVNYKEDLASDTYDIKLNLNTNYTIQEIDEMISIRGILLDKTTGEKYGYFEFERDHTVEDAINNSDSAYIAHLSTNRKFRKGKLSLADSLYDMDGNVIDNVYISQNCIIKIGILFNDPLNQYRTNDKINTETALFYDAFPSDLQANFNINHYVLATSMKTLDTVFLYKDLSKVMTSTVYRNPDQTNLPNESRDFMIEMIPLVGIEYFTSNNEYLFNLIDNYINIIDEFIPRLENATTVDLKFYNTRGPSKYFYLNTDIEMDSIAHVGLTRTDILLDFIIHVYEPINDEFDNIIKDFIADYIDLSNENGIIAISNLISQLENNFDVIRFIEFNGISGQYIDNVSNKYQKILSKNMDTMYMTKQEIIEYVPEYVNVKKQLYDNLVTIEDPETSLAHRISIGKRYDNVINISYEVL